MMKMANSRTVAVSTTGDGNLPEPDLPHRSSVKGVSVSSFISLRFKNSYIHVQIRQQELHFTRTSDMVSQRSVIETTRNKRPSHQPTGINQIMVENGDSWQCNLRREASADYTLRLGTFGSWPHRFLDPAVFAEAKFATQAMGIQLNARDAGENYPTGSMETIQVKNICTDLDSPAIDTVFFIRSFSLEKNCYSVDIYIWLNLEN